MNERCAVRVDEVIPVRTRAHVPIRSPLGSHDLTVPFAADIPLRGAIPPHLRHTCHLRAETDREIVVPLEIRAHYLPIAEMLRPALRLTPFSGRDKIPGSRRRATRSLPAPS